MPHIEKSTGAIHCDSQTAATIGIFLADQNRQQPLESDTKKQLSRVAQSATQLSTYSAVLMRRRFSGACATYDAV